MGISKLEMEFRRRLTIYFSNDPVAVTEALNEIAFCSDEKTKNASAELLNFIRPIIKSKINETFNQYIADNRELPFENYLNKALKEIFE